MKSFLFPSVAAATFLFGYVLVSIGGVFTPHSPVRPVGTGEGAVAASDTSNRKFTPTLRAYENGYVQGYESADGRTLSEGCTWFESSANANLEWKAFLKKAVRIVEWAPHSRNRFGEDGERVVAIFPGDAPGETRARILWYGGGDTLYYINAPTLDLALEFERDGAYAR